MDFHLLIVISCVFLASLFSLLFINKFFRRKTFEEIIAEKKAMTDKIYAQSKSTTKKPKKLQQQKKEQKREKKQRQKEQQRDNADEDSDAQSEQASIEDDEHPQGLSKTHVEFEPDPEILTYNNNENTTQTRRASITEKENASGGAATSKPKSKKDKKTAKSGILMNKNETVAVKETIVAEESQNNFEFKQPKDMVELKKQDKEKKEDKSQQQSKKEKSNKKEKQIVEQPAEPLLVNLPKELKQLEEKLVRQGSPKLNNNNNNNKIKQQTKKQLKETAATKELVVALDKLSETDTIGVSLLMNLFRRAELNRSEIQILIDYLLNKQQDMPATHAEWSDDICQKLKRQLEEKERALTEQLEASVGIQAKLRDLRTEVNTERAQMNATIKAYMEKLQSKEQEIAALNQDKQTFADKVELERQQFKAQVLREKQAGSQDLLAQLQMMQNEIVHKDKCISDLTCMMNASRQAVEDSQQKTSEIIQTQVQQIRALEQQRDDLEQISNNRVFELEQAKTLETENAESKVEIRNLQNALESANNDMLQVRNELVAITAELAMARNVELNEKQAEIQKLQTQNAELTAQIAGFNNKSQAQLQEQNGLQTTLDALKAQVAEKEQQVSEFNAKNLELLKQLGEAQSKREQVEQVQQQQLQQQQQQHQAEQQQQIVQQQQQQQLQQQQQQEQHQQQQEELKQSIEQLKTDVAAKSKQLLEVEQQAADKFNSKEKELLQQLQEQKEKNNDLRTKNWKLVEALQFAEKTANENKQLSNKSASVVEQQQLLAAAQKSITTATTTTTADSAKDQKQIRELFQRLYPDAVKACAGTALSLSFDQWIEQVLASHIKQSVSKLTPPPAAAAPVAATTASSSSNKSTQSNSSSNHSTHNHNNAVATTTASTETANNGSESREDAVDVAEMQKLRTHNTQLRLNIDELTKLVVKTGNTLSDLETRAREQDEHWRSIVRSKDEKINLLQHSNGKQDI